MRARSNGSQRFEIHTDDQGGPCSGVRQQIMHMHLVLFRNACFDRNSFHDDNYQYCIIF